MHFISTIPRDKRGKGKYLLKDKGGAVICFLKNLTSCHFRMVKSYTLNGSQTSITAKSQPFWWILFPTPPPWSRCFTFLFNHSPLPAEAWYFPLQTKLWSVPRSHWIPVPNPTRCWSWISYFLFPQSLPELPSCKYSRSLHQLILRHIEKYVRNSMF